MDDPENNEIRESHYSHHRGDQENSADGGRRADDHDHSRRDDDRPMKDQSNFYRTGFWIVLTNAITAVSLLLGAWATNGVSKADLVNALKSRAEVRDEQLKTMNARIDAITSDHQATMIKLDAMQADVIELKTVVIKSIRNR
jgi:hypothetical protein